MKYKMLKEERALRRYVGACIWTPGEVPNESESHARKLITALVKAVREDCNKALRIAAEDAYKDQVIDTEMTEMEPPREEWIESIMEGWQESAATIGGGNKPKVRTAETVLKERR